MKKLTKLADELKSAKPALHTITAMELRRSVGEILFRAENLNQTFVITRQGEPVAVLSGLPGWLDIVVDEDGKVGYSL